LNNGGGIWDIAIAMLETSDLNTDYTYGDGKSQDSANFGISKQSWFMLRINSKVKTHLNGIMVLFSIATLLKISRQDKNLKNKGLIYVFIFIKFSYK
jgi:hypothetical protein